MTHGSRRSSRRWTRYVGGTTLAEISSPEQGSAVRLYEDTVVSGSRVAGTTLALKYSTSGDSAGTVTYPTDTTWQCVVAVDWAHREETRLALFVGAVALGTLGYSLEASAASASIGPSSAANYCTSASYMDFVAERTAVILYKINTVKSQMLWSQQESTTAGWSVWAASASPKIQFLPTGSPSVAGTITVGVHCIALTRTAAGAFRAAMDGADAAGLTATYVSPTTALTQYVGRWAGGLAADGAEVLEIAMIGAAASDAELKSWSGCVNGLDRYQLPSAVRSHASLISGVAASDWNGSADPMVSPRGSSPHSYTIHGTVAKNTLASELTVMLRPEWFWDTWTPTDETYFWYVLPYAGISITTDASHWSVAAYTNTAAFASYWEIALVDDGVYYGTTDWANGPSMVRVLDATLPGASSAIQCWSGLQSGSSRQGPHIGKYIRLPTAAAFSVNLPAAPAYRVVALGDSITVGQAADPNVQSGWPVVYRLAHTARITVEAWGTRKLYDDRLDLAGLAATLVGLCDGTTGNTIAILLGTNDWAADLAAADFGGWYAALLDAIHAADATAVILCVSPLTRDGEAVANGAGSTLPDFRAQIVAAAGGDRAAYCVYLNGAAACTYPANFDTDLLHPNTAGQAELAGAISTAIGYE